jgi:hypothetical protein
MLKSIMVNGRMIHYDDPSNQHQSGEKTIQEKPQTQPELTKAKEEKSDVVVPPKVDSGETGGVSAGAGGESKIVRKKKSRLTL